MEGGVLHHLRNMSREDRRAFDGWLKANAAAGLVFTAVVIAMVLVGSRSARPDEAAVANGMKGSGGPAVTDGSLLPRHMQLKPPPSRYTQGGTTRFASPHRFWAAFARRNAGQVSIFPQLASEASNPVAPVRDIEYLRLVEWLRLTCQRVVNSK